MGGHIATGILGSSHQVHAAVAVNVFEGSGHASAAQAIVDGIKLVNGGKSAIDLSQTQPDPGISSTI